MNTFWGSETESVTALSAEFATGAARLGAVITAAARTVHATAWFGPDAEDHRRRTDEVVDTVTRLIETLRKLGELLEEEAAEQEVCSQPETAPGTADDPLGVRATPPWIPDPAVGLPPPRGTDGTEWGPMIGGPFMHPDPQGLVDRLPRLPDLDELWPMIGGPFMRPDPLRTVPAPHPLPEGEEFALDPEILAEAQADRKLGLGAIPVAGTVQTMMGVHGGMGQIFDRTEQNLEESGLGVLAPAVSMVRIPHTVSGAVLGSDSVPGQVISGIDDGIANVMQTSEEVSSAIGDGDLAGIARAGERGMYRHAGAMADILTATSVPALSRTASELIGTGADLAEPVSPEAAAPLRAMEQSTLELGQKWQNAVDGFTDAERYYDLRRKYLPTPWDPQG